jgi:hypothetical protein
MVKAQNEDAIGKIKMASDLAIVETFFERLLSLLTKTEDPVFSTRSYLCYFLGFSTMALNSKNTVFFDEKTNSLNGL